MPAVQTANISLVRSPGTHVICDITGAAPGPTLLAFGSLHGNEPAGAEALRRVAADLERQRNAVRGRVVFLAGNTRAIETGVRFVDADLNRHWTDVNIDRNRVGRDPIVSEDVEQSELLSLIDSVLKTARGEVYALDLHSTSAKGVPFATVGDTMRNRRFAQTFPVTILLGIEEQLDGTLLEYLNNLGAVTLGFEAGQHEAESTAANHEALVWLALVTAGSLKAADVPDLYKFRRQLTDTMTGPSVVEVRYRHAITPEDEFKMEPGFENFEPIRRGQFVASDRKGAIYAGESGMILMPLYQKQGEDGFFIGRRVAGFWLWLSRVLRQFKAGNMMHLLPGVSWSAEGAETLEIDTSTARFFPLQIFHLLGFRKLRWRTNKLVVSKRKFDTKGPFTSADGS
jgi:succinylglutamate desuccinylase